jgi:hypothetical protein
MLPAESRNRLVAIMSLFLIMALIPACSASAGHGLVRRPPAEAVVVPPTPYVAFRPAYPVNVNRPLFLGGYAGANYPSNVPGAVVTPTEFRMLTGKPTWPHWSWFGAGH